MTNPTFSRRSFLGTATGAAALAALPGGAFAKDILRMSTLGPGTSPNLVMTTFASIVNGALPDYEIQLNATGAATRHVLEVAMGHNPTCAPQCSGMHSPPWSGPAPGCGGKHC